ncbi:MAG: large protein [Flavipsychrobacter sp.]|nr:large protein [Flavipsychrobacter sp.]
MKRKIGTLFLLCIGGLIVPHTKSTAQITLLKDYKNYTSAPIGTFQGINFREAGFSGMFPIPNTNGKEFWICSDRGVNVDCASANPVGCTPTYDKLYAFPGYAPKIHRVRVNGDSVQILRTITMKRPGGTGATGIINPTGFGSTATEVASTDTVLNCLNFNSKVAAKDIWGVDAEGIVVDKNGYFWVCEEGGPSIWKMDQNGVVIKRYTPYANLPGAQSIDVQIDTAFKYRKNNRGFEGITIAPNGKIYAIIQSPILYPTTTVGESSRVHRILEIDPVSNATRMFVYLNDGIIGTGGNQIRLKDWKLGDMAAINDTTFLVLEAALRGTTDIKRIYKISINGATTVNSGLYSGVTLEALVDSAGLAANSIVPVKKTLFMDLLANGWDPALDKAEGLAILNDTTIVICNDNDYGQTSPLANGIATATTNLSHMVVYSVKGANKLTNFQPIGSSLSLGLTGPSTSQAPYVVPTQPGVNLTSILSANDNVGSYKMSGTPDGLGAFDNNDGTFTLVVNHEFGNTAGVTRAHGSIGAFVSKWVINKSDLSVVSGGDLMQKINLWNPLTSSYVTYNSSFPSTSAALNRFCSADLPEVSAFYNSATGKGTQERIFMNGEEAGNEGRAMGHIITGPAGGTTYELPYLGKFSWENSVASPLASDTTVVVGMDDGTPGQVYVYVGTKTTTGTDIDKAGLNNGKLYGVTVAGLINETDASVPTPGTAFTLTNMGSVQNMTGAALNTASNTAGVTNFLRPEDGAWDPQNYNDFYFATTNSFTSPSRLWRLRFTDAKNPTLGGTVSAVLDGTEGQKMLDNITIDNYGHILLVEDVGGNAHLGKVWQYTIATDVLKQVATHDSTRFLSGSANFLTIDEEASGILDVEKILGPGMFLTSDQAHYGIPGGIVEGGQLLAMFNPDTYNSAPEVNVKGNSIDIVSGDMTPSTADNTQFGNVNIGGNKSQTFVIQNTGAASLSVSGVSFIGANAGEFSLTGAPAFPLTIPSNGSQTITVRFAPLAGGSRSATINIASSDVDENLYSIALNGNGVDSPDINLQGNKINIIDGDLTPGLANNTDLGNVTLSSTVTKTFVIQNKGKGNLSVSGITFSGTHSGDFSLLSAPTFPLVIATADTYTISVQFAPGAPGVRSAGINIMSNDIDEATYDFAIQGAGVALPEISVKGNGISIADGDATAGLANNTDQGPVTVGSTQNKSFMIQNTGIGKLVITSISFTGANASEFTLIGAPAYPVNVVPGDSVMISVKFAPLATGVRNAEIIIMNTDSDEGIFNFALEGTGTGLAEINIQGNSLNIADGDVTAGTTNNTDFGNVNVGSMQTENFVIQNTGSASLSVSGVTFSGANASEFTLASTTTFPLTIAASSSQSFTVQFKPTAGGLRSATIAVANSDSDEGSYDFLLQGNGVTSTGVIAISEFTSFRLYPNPARDVATVDITLAKEGPVTITVSDVQGRTVLPVTDKVMTAGNHTLDMNTSVLTNGIYFVKIADGTSATTIKMVVVR